MRIVFAACTVFTLLLVVVACGDEDIASSVPSDDAGTDGSSPAPTPTSPPTSDSGGTIVDATPKADTAAPVDAALGPSYSGDATYYDAHGQNACGISQLGDYKVAAMNQDQWVKKEVCGECLLVTGPNGTVTVKVVDLCPGCSHGDLDLSEEAFQEIADLSAGRVNITWHAVKCP